MAENDQQAKNEKWANTKSVNWGKEYKGYPLSLHRFHEVERLGVGSEYAVVVVTSSGPPVVVVEFFSIDDHLATIKADGVVLGLSATILG